MQQEEQAPPANEVPDVAEAAAEWLADLPDWVPAPLRAAWEQVQQYPILGSMAIVILAIIAGKLVQAVVTRGLAKMAERTDTELDDELIRLLRKPVFLTVLLLGLVSATYALDLGIEMPMMLVKGTVRILLSLIVLQWFFTSLPACRLILDALARHQHRFPMVEARTLPLFDIITRVVFFGGATYVILRIWKIDATAWLASAGVLGIAIGFAAKDTLANLFSGFFIVADAPYKIGDYINLDSGERGMVTHVGMRSTRLLTRDDIEITLPNAVIANSKIINETGGRHIKERIRIKVGTAYGTDVDQVCEVLQAVAEAHAGICKDPAPRVRFRAFGASSLDFELLGWIDHPELRGKLSHELHMEVYKAFEQAGIEIPFTKQDLYIKEIPK